MGWSSGTAGSRSSGSGSRSHPSPDLFSSMFVLHCIPTGLQAPHSVAARQTSRPASHIHPGEYSDWPAGPHAHHEDCAHLWLCPPPGHWDEGRIPQRIRHRPFNHPRALKWSPSSKKGDNMGTSLVSGGWEPACHCSQTGLIPTGHEATGPPEPQLLQPRACAPQPEKPPQQEACTPQLANSPRSPQLEKALAQQGRPTTNKSK